MRMPLPAVLLLCELLPVRPVRAQGADPNLMHEAAAVRMAVAQSNAALRQYTWTEHTEVVVDGDVKSSKDLICRYNNSGDLTKTPVGDAEAKKDPSGISKRPMVRKKAGMQDYIERAVSMIQEYVPPKPEQLQYLLQNGGASLGESGNGTSEIRFVNYFQRGDSLVFTYDSASKALLRANISTSLASPKDPVTLEAVFETLPDGVNHLASTTLNAKAKRVEVKTRNTNYQRVAN